MMWSLFLTAIGLVFVLEGILPFLSPRIFRQMMLRMVAQSDQALRIVGFLLMLAGLALVCIARDLY